MQQTSPKAKWPPATPASYNERATAAEHCNIGTSMHRCTLPRSSHATHIFRALWWQSNILRNGGPVVRTYRLISPFRRSRLSPYLNAAVETLKDTLARCPHVLIHTPTQNLSILSISLANARFTKKDDDTEGVYGRPRSNCCPPKCTSMIN